MFDSLLLILSNLISDCFTLHAYLFIQTGNIVLGYSNARHVSFSLLHYPTVVKRLKTAIYLSFFLSAVGNQVALCYVPCCSVCLHRAGSLWIVWEGGCLGHRGSITTEIDISLSLGTEIDRCLRAMCPYRLHLTTELPCKSFIIEYMMPISFHVTSSVYKLNYRSIQEVKMLFTSIPFPLVTCESPSPSHLQYTLNM